MRTRFSVLAVLVAFAMTFALVPMSRADLVSIGLQQAGFNLGAITTVASGGGSAVFAGPYGTFVLNLVTATGTPPLAEPNLNTTSINASTTTAGTIKVWITEQGLTSPAALTSFLSGFTENSITAGWTVTENSYLDLGNGLYATTTPLGTQTFTAIGSAVASTSVDLSTVSGSSPYSVTVLYTITSTDGNGSANSTINLSVPEPASMMLLGTGLLGIGGIFRRRIRK